MENLGMKIFIRSGTGLVLISALSREFGLGDDDSGYAFEYQSSGASETKPDSLWPLAGDVFRAFPKSGWIE